MTTLWLVRHAQPRVAPGVCYGQLDLAAEPDATLTCAAALLAELPARLHIVSSPLQRCEQLAQAIIGLQPDLAYKTDARLQEMHFGRWEGLRWDSIARAELQRWTDDFANYPAGQTGESVNAFMQRVGDAVDARAPGLDTLWVTHAGVVRAAALIASGMRRVARADQWPVQAPAYGQWWRLDF